MGEICGLNKQNSNYIFQEREICEAELCIQTEFLGYLQKEANAKHT